MNWQHLQQLFSFSDEILKKLSLYQNLVLETNQKLNLIGKGTEKDIYSRHFLDSAQLIKLLNKNPKSWLDIGTGAGFPGMVIAICLPQVKVHLVDSINKKCKFLEKVKDQLSLKNIEIHNQRIENMKTLFNIEIISARAVTSLDNLINYSKTYLAKGSICLFMLGETQLKETEKNCKKYHLRYEIFPSITNKKSAIVKLYK